MSHGTTARCLTGVLLLAAIGLLPWPAAQAAADRVRTGRVAFEAGTSPTRFSPVGLFSVEATGGGPVPISPLVASGANWNIGSPSWSPDGRRIAFARFVDGDPELFVANADGGDERRLTFDPAWDYQPAWSPDGTRIAFVTSRFLAGTSSGAVVATVAPDGSDLERLTSDEIVAGSPAWSPDGRWIAFSNVIGPTEGRQAIWLMASDGTRARQVTPGPYDRDPSVTQRHGRRLRIAFTSRASPEGEADIAQVRVRVRGPVRIARATRMVADRAQEIDPAFSPDGRHLAFARYAEGPEPYSRLMVRDLRSGREHELLPDGATALGLTWFQAPDWTRCGPRGC